MANGNKHDEVDSLDINGQNGDVYAGGGTLSANFPKQGSLTKSEQNCVRWLRQWAKRGTRATYELAHRAIDIFEDSGSTDCESLYKFYERLFFILQAKPAPTKTKNGKGSYSFGQDGSR